MSYQVLSGNSTGIKQGNSETCQKQKHKGMWVKVKASKDKHKGKTQAQGTRDVL